jgi:hypothetical protein
MVIYANEYENIPYPELPRYLAMITVKTRERRETIIALEKLIMRFLKIFLTFDICLPAEPLYRPL